MSEAAPAIAHLLGQLLAWLKSTTTPPGAGPVRVAQPCRHEGPQQ